MLQKRTMYVVEFRPQTRSPILSRLVFTHALSPFWFNFQIAWELVRSFFQDADDGRGVPAAACEISAVCLRSACLRQESELQHDVDEENDQANSELALNPRSRFFNSVSFSSVTTHDSKTLLSSCQCTFFKLTSTAIERALLSKKAIPAHKHEVGHAYISSPLSKM